MDNTARILKEVNALKSQGHRFITEHDIKQIANHLNLRVPFVRSVVYKKSNDVRARNPLPKRPEPAFVGHVSNNHEETLKKMLRMVPKEARDLFFSHLRKTNELR